MKDLEKLFKFLDIVWKIRDCTAYDSDNAGKLIYKLSTKAIIKILNLIDKICEKGE